MCKVFAQFKENWRSRNILRAFFPHMQDQNFETGEVHHGAKILQITKKARPL